MDPYDSPLRSLPNSPFPHSLLRTRESSRAPALGFSCLAPGGPRLGLGSWVKLGRGVGFNLGFLGFRV